MAFRIAVTGTPGIGKSTLVAKVAAATGMRVGRVYVAGTVDNPYAFILGA